MIADISANSGLYAKVHRDFARAFAALEKCESMTLPAENGTRIEVDGVKIIVQRYETREMSDHEFEGHRKNIDIQYMLEGREIMYWATTEGLRVTTPYDEEREFLSYDGGEGYTPLRLSKGQFAIFFPTDAHKPACAWDLASHVVKLVAKISI